MIAPSKSETSDNQRSAVVVSASRRHVFLSPDMQNLLKGTTATKALEVSIGDIVNYEATEGEVFITSIQPRRNQIIRTYRGENKTLACNVDRVFIVTSVLPLFSPLFIDRVLTVAAIENIPCTLVLNKTDKGIGATHPFLEAYRKLDLHIVMTSAKYDQGLEPIRALLEDSGICSAALVGISGVGKSTLLNTLIPNTDRKTQEVNIRTGHGRQTTTQAFGYMYQRPSAKGLLLIDLPGVQSFGVTHLSKEQVAFAFPEIQALTSQCEFSDCGHVSERICAVRDAAVNGQFPISRYESYCHMVEEIESNKEY